MKIIRSQSEFQELAKKIQSERSEHVPAAYDVESVEVKDIALPGKPDQFGRYTLTVAGQTILASLFRGTPADLPAYDLAACRSTRKVEVQGTNIVYPAGTPAWRLVAPK